MAVIKLFFILVTAPLALGIQELVPERYLRPRDFNHHPLTDVGVGAPLKQQITLPDTHPYALLASKRPREGRQFPDQNVVLYPNPPSEVLPKKQQSSALRLQYSPQLHVQPQLQLQLQPQVHQKLPVSTYPADPYNSIPKNYAFSYTVRDQHSGDDFSHSQAHNGKATRGQYRVKLPDGRVQVVSYTADHKGYRADVQYEGELAKASYAGKHQPTPQYEHHTAAPETYHQVQQPIEYVQDTPQHRPTPAPYILHSTPASYSPTPEPYHSYSPTSEQYHSYSPTSEPYHAPQYVQTYARPTPNYAYQPEQYSPTPSPQTYEQSYASPSPTSYAHDAYPSPSPQGYAQQGLQAYASPTAKPYTGSEGLSAYASPSPTPYEDVQYASPSPTPYDQSHYSPSGSGSLFSVQPFLRSTPSPFARHQYVTSTEAPYAHDQYVSSTEAPNGHNHILVTPRSIFKNELSRRGFTDSKDNRSHVLYRFSSPS